MYNKIIHMTSGIGLFSQEGTRKYRPEKKVYPTMIKERKRSILLKHSVKQTGYRIIYGG